MRILYAMKQTGIVLVALVLMAIHGPMVFAASAAAEGPTVLQSGNSIVKSFPAPGAAACKLEVEKLAAGLKRYCRTEFTTKALPPPPAIDCVVSAPVETSGPWSACSAGTHTRTITSTLTVATQPANGGKACPVLVTTRTESEACAVAPPPPPPATWVKCADEDGTCTLTVAGVVRYGAGTKWAEKSFPAGPVKCDNATFGDPAFMVAKTCEVGGSTQPPPPPPPPTPAVGTAALTWPAPTKYSDGTAITSPVTYKVYHGTSVTALTDVIPVSATSYSFSQLASGTHYFAVSSVVAGVEGVMSGVGMKAIP